MASPFISICIPAYKHTDYLERLLNSIAAQTFKDYEVIVTDDSPDDSVQQLCERYQSSVTLKYFKNETALGSPENWNAGIRKAAGQWIKMMHDDDWFAHERSLELYTNAIKTNKDKKFFFSAFYNVFSANRKELVQLKPYKKFFLQQPVRLISENVIGPPSVTIYRNDKDTLYDKELKWLVDIDFYIRYLGKSDYFYIDEGLVNIGISQDQVTQYSFRVAQVEIPEHFHVLNKLGYGCLRDLTVYDAFWRLIRNLNIRDSKDIRAAGFEGVIPKSITLMIHFQKKIPQKMLQVGALSKALMATCYSFTFVRKILNK